MGLCACAQSPDVSEPTGTEPSASQQETTENAQVEVFYPRWPEAAEQTETKKDFAHVDESQPNSAGVYELHSVEGLQQLYHHPDGSFKLLCDIDLQGAQWEPIPEFTGQIEGQKYTISNFTVTTGDHTGFIGVNKGTVKNLYLDQVNIVVNRGVAGGLVAVNEGVISGCRVDGSLSVSGNAVAGGLVGQMSSGSLLYSECAMDRTAQTGTTVGLLGGALANVQAEQCSFSGSGLLDNAQLNALAGSEENVTYTDCLWRDNSATDDHLTDESLRLRQIAIDETYRMGTVEWTVSEVINYIHPTGGANLGSVFIPGTVYTGIPYTANFGDLSRFLYCFEEDGSLKDFATRVPVGFDGMDMYMGCDCSGGVYWGWAKVSPSTQWILTSQMLPVHGLGTVPVGQYEGSTTLQDTMQITKANDPQTMAEAYAQLHMSDAVTTWYTNPDDASDHFNHTRLVVESPVVMRNTDGTINLDASYVTTHEQGKGSLNTSWCMYGKYTFQQLWDAHYIPLTCQEFIDGAAPELEVNIDTADEGKAYMATGIVSSNYRLVSTNVTVTDEAGQSVFDQTVFVNIRRYSDVGTHELSRNHITEQDLAVYAAYLGEMELESGKTYTYTLTANTPAGDVIVKTFTFVQ